MGSARTSTGKNERMDRVNGSGESVGLGFESLYVTRLDPMGVLGGGPGRSDLTVRDEHLVGKPAEERLLLRPVGQERFGHAELGRQLVVASQGADARRGLVYACTTSEAGVPAITGAGIEPRGTRASGRQGSASSGDPRPWMGQYEMLSTSLCLASCRHDRQMNPLRLAQAIPSSSVACIPKPRALAIKELTPLPVGSASSVGSAGCLARRPAECRETLTMETAQLLDA
jgi:hypothetical protein